MTSVNVSKEMRRIVESNILLCIKGSRKATAADREAAAIITTHAMEAVEAFQQTEEE